MIPARAREPPLAGGGGMSDHGALRGVPLLPMTRQQIDRRYTPLVSVGPQLPLQQVTANGHQAAAGQPQRASEAGGPAGGGGAASARSLGVQVSGRNGSARSGTAHSGGGDVDIVQFAAPTFYAEEDQGEVEIWAIRLGHCRGSCAVDFETRDGSAKAGKKYSRLAGTLNFGPGVCRQSFKIPIVDDEEFDTSISFHVDLKKRTAVGCEVDPELCHCEVMILDNDLFPSNQFAEEIKEGTDAALHRAGFKLLGAFMKFTWRHVPTIWWKTILMLLLAQLGNAYYLLTIYLRVYLVDVCLNSKDDSTMDRLVIKGSRSGTALFLGALWILPNFILTLSDFYEMSRLEMGYHIRYFLRVNLFRKYLNYTPDSRAQVPIQDLKTSMIEDIPDLVSNGYLILFELWRVFGKIACVAFFMVTKHPHNTIPLVVYPVLIAFFIGCCYKRRLEILSKSGEAESETQGWLVRAHNAHALVSDYKKRSYMVAEFERILLSQRQLTIMVKYFTFTSELLIPWITLVAIGTYMGIGAHHVLQGSISLGAYLATINVYKDLGDRFQNIYSAFVSLSEAIDPLSGLTGQFNLDTDTLPRKRSLQMRQTYVNQFLERNGTSSKGDSMYDDVPIQLKDINVDHALGLSPKGGLNIQAPQGNIIFISGPHDCGKSTLMHILTDGETQSAGCVLCPPHLRIVTVSYQPAIIGKLGMYENVMFGLPNAGRPERHPTRHHHQEGGCCAGDCWEPDREEDERDEGPTGVNTSAESMRWQRERARRILRRMGLAKPWIMAEFEKGAARADARADNDVEDFEEGRSSPLEKRPSLLEVAGMSPTCSEAKMENGSDVDSGGEDDEPGDDDQGWCARLSNSERKRLHLARAFVYNPEVVVLHRPLDALDSDLSKQVCDMLREFVDNRGVELDPATMHKRRPRTVFFTGGSSTTNAKGIADVIWRVSHEAGVVVDRVR